MLIKIPFHDLLSLACTPKTSDCTSKENKYVSIIRLEVLRPPKKKRMRAKRRYDPKLIVIEKRNYIAELSNGGMRFTLT